MASAFSSDVKITSNQQPKRLALDGGEYTYNEFKNHNRENLGEEKWKQVTELLISDLTVDENEKTHEPKDCKTKMRVPLLEGSPRDKIRRTVVPTVMTKRAFNSPKLQASMMKGFFFVERWSSYKYGWVHHGQKIVRCGV